MMDPKQRDLLEHVIMAFDAPEKTKYHGMPWQQAFKELGDKLREIKKIDDYDRAMGMIK